jgi:hypothetical protein
VISIEHGNRHVHHMHHGTLLLSADSKALPIPAHNHFPLFRPYTDYRLVVRSRDEDRGDDDMNGGRGRGRRRRRRGDTLHASLSFSTSGKCLEGQKQTLSSKMEFKVGICMSKCVWRERAH